MIIGLDKLWYICIGKLRERIVWLYVVSKEGGISERAKIFIFQIKTSIDNAYIAQSKSYYCKYII